MSTQVETIKVDGVSMKFGNGSVIVGDTWYSIAKNAKTPTGEDLSGDFFSKGNSYSVVTFESEAGKKYIKGIANGAAAPVSKPISNIVPAKVSDFTKSDDRMSKEEWSAKDKRISKQGFLQAALKAVVAGGYTPELDKARELALETAKVQYEQVWGEAW